jgi:hypothetical protein
VRGSPWWTELFKEAPEGAFYVFEERQASLAVVEARYGKKHEQRLMRGPFLTALPHINPLDTITDVFADQARHGVSDRLMQRRPFSALL